MAWYRPSRGYAWNASLLTFFRWQSQRLSVTIARKPRITRHGREAFSLDVGQIAQWCSSEEFLPNSHSSREVAEWTTGDSSCTCETNGSASRPILSNGPNVLSDNPARQGTSHVEETKSQFHVRQRPSRPPRRRARSSKQDCSNPVSSAAPDPKGLVLDLKEIVDSSEITAIKNAKKLVFHTVGDTGGVRDGAAQQTLIAEAMEDDFSGDASGHPAFFYHLGDVVYYNSEPDNYVTQYFKPYQYYPAPIVAIPGNHDSSPSTTETPGNLNQFIKVFCDKTPKPLVPDFDRTSMIQPYIYFTLEAPFVKIIGLYSNDGEGPGVLDPDGDTAQLEFLEAEFQRVAKARPTDSRTVLVAVHHPLFAIGKDHGAFADNAREG